MKNTKEWWMVERVRTNQQRSRDLCSRSQRPNGLPHPVSVTLFIFSLPHLKITLTLTASHSSPFTLVFLKFIYAFSLLTLDCSSLMAFPSASYSDFPNSHFKILAVSGKGQFLLRNLWCLWALYWYRQCPKGKYLNFISSITCGSEPYIVSHHRLSSG